MGTIRFNLRSDKADKQGRCPVELIYQISGQRKYYLLKEAKLLPANWSKEEQCAIYLSPAKAKAVLKDHPQFKEVLLLSSEVEEVNHQIAAVRTEVRNAEKRFELDEIIYTASMITEALKSSTSGKTRKEEHKDYLFDFMDKYIEDHKHSREKGSLGVYNSVKNHLLSYQTQTRNKVRFESIDYSFFQSFHNFLIKQGKHNNTTIAKALSTLKTFLGYAKRNGITISDSYRDYKIKREKLEVIALTEEEFKSLQELDLGGNKRLDQVRDVFCFSCASGLRISDMQQLKREHIKKDEIVLFVKKTKTELSIPLNKVTAGILSKYEDQMRPLPMISDQKLNEYIKEVCEKAGINDPVEIVRYRGNRREVTTYPKYELIHMHTGRKTFCTLSLERGMSAEQVMGTTGHTDYKSFKRYVYVSEKQKKAAVTRVWGEVPILKVVS